MVAVYEDSSAICHRDNESCCTVICLHLYSVRLYICKSNDAKRPIVHKHVSPPRHSCSVLSKTESIRLISIPEKFGLFSAESKTVRMHAMTFDQSDIKSEDTIANVEGMQCLWLFNLTYTHTHTHTLSLSSLTLSLSFWFPHSALSLTFLACVCMLWGVCFYFLSIRIFKLKYPVR